MAPRKTEGPPFDGGVAARPPAKKAARTFKLPKTLAAAADALYQVRAKRLEAAKGVEELQAEETALKNYLIENLPKSDASGVAGKLCRVSIVTKVKPRVEDWDAFYKYVGRTKSYDLLQRRLAEKAVEERWDAKKQVPGVGTFNVVDVSIGKVK